MHRIENTAIETEIVAIAGLLVGFKFIFLEISKYLLSEMNQIFAKSIIEIFVLKPKH